jgi:hypothetical protein
MKKNVNVFIGVVLCALLCGTFVWLTGTDENDTWKPNEIYDQVHTTTSTGSSTTNATFSNPSNGDGLALRMSSGASLRRPAVSSYAGAYGATSNFSSSTYGGASGAGLHMTSNAEVKSFGGGGNGVRVLVKAHQLAGGKGRIVPNDIRKTGLDRTQFIICHTVSS